MKLAINKFLCPRHRCNNYCSKAIDAVEGHLFANGVLPFLVKLLHLKIFNRWSNKSFTMLLELLNEALPEGETLPASYYEPKQNTLIRPALT
ncbi:hypothetical protein ACOSQ3_004793 [Xanthoceras sorbifolium]